MLGEMLPRKDRKQFQMKGEVITAKPHVERT
jgi:hypothetical protein